MWHHCKLGGGVVCSVSFFAVCPVLCPDEGRQEGDGGDERLPEPGGSGRQREAQGLQRRGEDAARDQGTSSTSFTCPLHLAQLCPCFPSPFHSNRAKDGGWRDLHHPFLDCIPFMHKDSTPEPTPTLSHKSPEPIAVISFLC